MQVFELSVSIASLVGVMFDVKLSQVSAQFVREFDSTQLQGRS